jgi:short subunit fatty acids transporter
MSPRGASGGMQFGLLVRNILVPFWSLFELQTGHSKYCQLDGFHQIVLVVPEDPVLWKLLR